MKNSFRPERVDIREDREASSLKALLRIGQLRTTASGWQLTTGWHLPSPLLLDPVRNAQRLRISAPARDLEPLPEPTLLPSATSATESTK